VTFITAVSAKAAVDPEPIPDQDKSCSTDSGNESIPQISVSGDELKIDESALSSDSVVEPSMTEARPGANVIKLFTFVSYDFS
jgi:hypothetical protein